MVLLQNITSLGLNQKQVVRNTNQATVQIIGQAQIGNHVFSMT